MLNVTSSPLVVRSNLYWVDSSGVHLSADQRLRWVPVCRGRNTVIVMGTRASYLQK